MLSLNVQINILKIRIESPVFNFHKKNLFIQVVFLTVSWNSTVRNIDTINLLNLKELRNCILYINHMRSLFWSVWVYLSLHFLSILLKNYIFRLHDFFVFCWIWIQYHLKRPHNIFLIIDYRCHVVCNFFSL